MSGRGKWLLAAAGSAGLVAVGCNALLAYDEGALREAGGGGGTASGAGTPVGVGAGSTASGQGGDGASGAVGGGSATGGVAGGGFGSGTGGSGGTGTGGTGGTGGTAGSGGSPALACHSGFSAFSPNPLEAAKTGWVTFRSSIAYVDVTLEASGPGSPQTTLDDYSPPPTDHRWTWLLTGHQAGILTLRFLRDDDPPGSGVAVATCQHQVVP